MKTIGLFLMLVLVLFVNACGTTASFWSRQASYTQGPSWTPGADLEQGGKAVVAIGCHRGLEKQPEQWGFAWSHAELDAVTRANEFVKRLASSKTEVKKGYTYNNKKGLNEHNSVERNVSTQSKGVVSFPETIGRGVFDDGLFCIKYRLPIQNIKTR